MTTVDNLRGYVARLAQRFDENIRTSVSDPTQKGWGQFIAAEHHSHQIGLYGTSAGILVKTIASSQTQIDHAVQKYLSEQWNLRHNQSQKYFNQTIRLAFLILALARAEDQLLKTIRDEAVKELVGRQRRDGAWGDWAQDGEERSAPPRAETTAWAVLALTRLNESSTKNELTNGARFLQLQALSFARIEAEVDPLVLGVILQASPHVEIDPRVHRAAVAFLSQERPGPELHIYFFDYVLNETAVQQVKRDYLCVPRFFAYCLLAGAPTIGHKTVSPESLRVALAHWRAIKQLEAILESEPLRTSQSRYPATVDQAFVALAVEYLARRSLRFGYFFDIGIPVFRSLRQNFVVRVLFPLLVLSVLGAVAHEPMNVSDLVVWTRGTESEALHTFVEKNASVLQVLAIGLGFLLGQPLLRSIKTWFQKAWFRL
jgi:hypothetical protein